MNCAWRDKGTLSDILKATINITMPNLKKTIKKVLAHRKSGVWEFKMRMEILIIVIAISLFIIITHDGVYYNDFNEILAVFFSTVLILYVIRANS